MNKIKRVIAIAAVAAVSLVGLTACSDSDLDDRKEKQNTVTLKDSLELSNLKEKLERENDPNTVRYVYLMNFGQIVGYYVIKGKVSSNGSQLAPEQEVVRWNGEMISLDSAQDDGSYGEGDEGYFFFLADGTMITTDLNIIQADQPLEVDVPRLGGSE